MCNRMNITHADLINRHAGMIGGERHAEASLSVIWLCHCLRQPLKNALHSKTRILFSSPSIPNTDISFDTVGQRIDSRRCRHRGRHTQQ